MEQEAFKQSELDQAHIKRQLQDITTLMEQYLNSGLVTELVVLWITKAAETIQQRYNDAQKATS